MQGRQTKVKVSLNGVDITSDLTGDTLSLTFNDSAEENADNVDFQIQNRRKEVAQRLVSKQDGYLLCSNYRGRWNT